MSRRPLGMAVVGGMITSTFLTLFVVPVVYTLFDDLRAKFAAKKSEWLPTIEDREYVRSLMKPVTEVGKIVKHLDEKKLEKLL